MQSPPTSRTRQRLILAACLVVLCLAVLRAGLLVGHAPLLGLANNYDMIRAQACIDAWPVRDESIPPWSNSWQAPIPRYAFREGVGAPCHVGTESLLAIAMEPVFRALARGSPDGSFPLRAMGWAKVALLAGMLLLVCAAFATQRAHGAALTAAVLGLVVVSDPLVTIYFNSFYAEGIAAVLAFAAVGCTLAAVRASRPPWWLLLAVVLLVVAVSMAKIQHVLFGVFLLACIGLAAWWFRLRPAKSALIALAAGSLLGAVLQFAHMQGSATESIRHANATNTYLLTVLGSSENPHTTAERLGLPAACGDHAGKSWLHEGVQADHPCPELYGLHRPVLLKLLVLEPQTLARVVWRGLGLSRPIGPPVLGRVEGGVSAPLPDAFSSVERLLVALPAWAYAAVFLVPGFIVLGIALLRPRMSPAGATALLVTGLYPYFALLSVVFGDGYADVAKQLHLGTVALAGFWVVLVAVLLDACWRAWRHDRRDRLRSTRACDPRGAVLGDVHGAVHGELHRSPLA